MIKPNNNATTVWNAAEYLSWEIFKTTQVLNPLIRELTGNANFSQVKQVSDKNKLENQLNKSAQNTGRMIFETVEFPW